jgi:hypothetical protein
MTKSHCRTIWPWWCDGCQRMHGGRVERFGIGWPEKLYCEREFFKVLDKIQAERFGTPLAPELQPKLF